jgi:hypothetical protein
MPMKSTYACLVIALALLCPLPARSQALRLPRESERLVMRAQSFWASMVNGQVLKATEFVLPETRDAFLSQKFSPTLGAKVLGVDLTGDPDQATIRIEIQVMNPQLSLDRTFLTITDNWVWRRNNWFKQTPSKPMSFMPDAGNSDVATELNKHQIDASLMLLEDSVDLGTITPGPTRQIEIPIRYSGSVPLTVDQVLPLDFLAVRAPSGRLTSDSKSLDLYVNSEAWTGPFAIALPIRFSYLGASIQRVLTVRGEVFLPISFRQVPADGVVAPDGRISVFVSNNTSETVYLNGASVDSKLDVVADGPQVLEPNREYEWIFKLIPNETPDTFYIQTRNPLYGRDTFRMRFRIGR